MNKFFKFGLLVATFGWLLQASAAEVATETRPVDARIVRVKVDGLVDVRIRQGSPATLTLRGDADWVKRTMTNQSGDTLNIDTDAHGVRVREGFQMHGFSGIRVELTLPHLREVWSESLGNIDISGFNGDELELTLEGVGSINAVSSYRRVTANLGGFGSMNLRGLDCEGVELNLRGAGSVSVTGRSKWLKADLGGLGGLNAQTLTVDTVNLDLSGLGNAVVTAHQNATINLSGMGSATVLGKPLNRHVENVGLGKVSFK